ncbi:putative cytochrome P450 [Helianthus annuus]|nr:putative cytochrome P450 [Helianthus annuus]KAJ0937439.1 putative cytochrome P450 [Helianthus annuus]
MWHIGLCIAALVVISITYWVYKWRNPKCNGNLPPGSMGLPLFGESLQFFAPNRRWDTPPFFKERIERYGTIFRTSLVGLPVIVSSDSELNQMVFQQEGHLFQLWYPDSMTKVLGKQNLGSLHGYMHKYLKNMVQNLVGHASLKKMILEVESVTTRHIEKWANQETVELRTATADMIFDLTAKKLISYDLEKSSENLRENFDDFMMGLVSIPLAIPGTAHHKCLKGRKKVMKVLKNMLEERRAKPNEANTDFFDYVLEELKKDDTILTEEIALDLMFLLLFASFETTSLAVIVAIKLLTDNPRALKELTEEHEKILRDRENPVSGLTWKEYKSMTFTFQVCYTIPSGWVVIVCPPAVHLNHENYADPLDFNPWRWKDLDLTGASQNFMAFGGGLRFCSGADFARLEMAIFLHCIVTRYRWQLVKGGGIVRTPGLQFPDGFYVRFSKKDKHN